MVLGDPGHGALPVSLWSSSVGSSVTVVPQELAMYPTPLKLSHPLLEPAHLLACREQILLQPYLIGENTETQEGIVTSHSHAAAKRPGQD